METGVIIARFQTPYLHAGHIELIEKVKCSHNKLIIILGISPITGSRYNPYDYYTREKMIKTAYNDIVVLPLSDHPDDRVWSANLDNLLASAFPTETFILYGSRDSFIPYYSGKYDTNELPEHGDYSATELRKKYADKVLTQKNDPQKIDIQKNLGIEEASGEWILIVDADEVTGAVSKSGAECF